MKTEQSYWEILIGQHLNETTAYLATSRKARFDVYGNEIPFKNRIAVNEARGHVVYDFEHGE